MAQPGDTLRLTATEWLVIETSTADLLAMEAHYGPGAKPPPAHHHPAQEERFTGISGTVRARIDGVERTIGPGETVTIPPGANHSFWNPSSEEAVLTWEVRPALNTEQMFEDLADAGSTLKQGLVLTRYKAEFRLASTPQRLLLDAIAPVAGLIGRSR
jgi:quercetin dioxygenase-like cupin family protein